MKSPLFFQSKSTGFLYTPTQLMILVLILAGGTMLRFWGLGNIGLHGDEETMAMPALAILESGKPLLPSGMLYPRAIAQLYLMASSVWLFGDTEWALRLPSAVTGSLLILIAFFMGKRFLRPEWNLVFVAVIALLPSMITLSQTARMYIFFSAALMLFAIAIFWWERGGSWSRLMGAVAVFLLALQFHKLSIFAALLFFYPFVITPSRRLLLQGTVGFLCAISAFGAFSTWVDMQYGERYSATSVESEQGFVSGLMHVVTEGVNMLGSVGSFIGVLFVLFATGMLIFSRRLGVYRIAAVLFLSGAIASLLLHNHVAALLLAVGALFHGRNGGGKLPPALMFLAFGVVMVVQAVVLLKSGDYQGLRQVLGAMVGMPSVWPYLRFAEHFALAVAFYFVPLTLAASMLVRKKPIPDHFAFFGISVWLILFLIGFFKWFLPPRYTYGAVVFFIPCCVAGAQYVWDNWIGRLGVLQQTPTIAHALAAIAVIAMFVNPLELQRRVNVNFGNAFPDHAGAAAFIGSLELGENDKLLAEDVLQQTYYLGKVDYWLRAQTNAQLGFIRKTAQGFRDIYTNTPLIGTGAELERLLRQQQRGKLYIIGSGETYDGSDLFLGDGIKDTMRQWDPKIIYRGRDGKTFVWLIE